MYNQKRELESDESETRKESRLGKEERNRDRDEYRNKIEEEAQT